MNPRPLPQRYAKKWEQWPTLDQLRDQNKELKLHQLRDVLKKVACYRCPDGSVHYVPEQVTAALLKMPPDADELDDQADEDSDDLDSDLTPPKTYDVLMLFRECMRMLADARRERRDTVVVMETPLKTGLDLVEKMVGVMVGRLEAYDKIWDRMMATTERLMSHQAERELEVQRERDKQELRKKTLGLASEYVPTLLQQLGPSAEAALALKAFGSLEPEMVDSLLGSGALQPEQQELFGRLRDVLAKQRPPQQQAHDNGNSHAPS